MASCSTCSDRPAPVEVLFPYSPFNTVFSAYVGFTERAPNSHAYNSWLMAWMEDSEVASQLSGDGLVVVNETGGQPAEFKVEVHFQNGGTRDGATTAEVCGYHDVDLLSVY